MMRFSTAQTRIELHSGLGGDLSVRRPYHPWRRCRSQISKELSSKLSAREKLKRRRSIRNNRSLSFSLSLFPPFSLRPPSLYICLIVVFLSLSFIPLVTRRWTRHVHLRNRISVELCVSATVEESIFGHVESMPTYFAVHWKSRCRLRRRREMCPITSARDAPLSSSIIVRWFHQIWNFS